MIKKSKAPLSLVEMCVRDLSLSTKCYEFITNYSRLAAFPFTAALIGCGSSFVYVFVFCTEF